MKKKGLSLAQRQPRILKKCGEVIYKSTHRGGSDESGGEGVGAGVQSDNITLDESHNIAEREGGKGRLLFDDVDECALDGGLEGGHKSDDVSSIGDGAWRRGDVL